MNSLRKIIQISTYYFLPIVLATGSIVFQNRWIYSKYGSIAFLLLTGNLYLKPVSVLFRNKLFTFISTYRREMGIASFWFYLFHSSGLYLLNNLSLSSFSNTSSYLFWALPAAIGMWLLGVTSNDISVKRLGRNWKRLHRIAYFVFFFALIHSSLAEREVGKIFILSIPFIILKYFEYKKIPFVW